jgi:lipopolysaccharide export system permease protein
MRSVALSKEITMKTKNGFWARDGNSYVNIRKILPGNRIQDIYIYEFDNQDKLRSSTHAWRAKYEHNRWLLERIRQTVINGNVVTHHFMHRAAWESILDPELLNLVVVQPEYLTIWGLVRYIEFLHNNAQNSLPYRQALWIKLILPLSIIAMVVLAVPLVQGYSRSTALGQRVFVGTVIGVIFHILNQASQHLGLVYQLPPPISAGAPTLLLVLTLLWFLSRDLVRLPGIARTTRGR